MINKKNEWKVGNLLEEDLDSFDQEELHLPIFAAFALPKFAEFEIVEADWLEKDQIIPDFDQNDPNRIRRGPVLPQQ